MKFGNFSSLKKLFRVTYYVLHFVKLAKLQSDKDKILAEVIFCDEMSTAKYLWLLREQDKVLKPQKSSQTKMPISLFCDENYLLHLKGQLGNSECSDDFKHPIFLPHDIL